MRDGPLGHVLKIFSSLSRSLFADLGELAENISRPFAGFLSVAVLNALIRQQPRFTGNRCKTETETMCRSGLAITSQVLPGTKGRVRE